MSLDTLKRTNSLDKLLGAVQQENAPLENKSYKETNLCRSIVQIYTEEDPLIQE